MDSVQEFIKYRENLFQTFVCTKTTECNNFVLNSIPPNPPKLTRKNANTFQLYEVAKVPCLYCQQITEIPLIVSQNVYNSMKAMDKTITDG